MSIAVLAITDLEEDVLRGARVVFSSALDGADISGKDEMVLIETRDQRALSCEDCKLSQSKDVRLLELRNGEHDVGDFVVVIDPYTSSILPVGIVRGEIDGDGGIVVRVDGGSPCAPRSTCPYAACPGPL